MYSIFADDQCIYNDVNNMDMFRLVSPELDLSDNASGTLTMTLPPSNAGYDKIQRLKTKITVYRDNVEMWCGRAIQEEVDFWKNKKITCEGELGYLNDTLQPQREFENPTVEYFLREIITTHNSKVSADKRFNLGIVTVTDKMENEDAGSDEYFDDIYVYTNYETTLSCISNKLVNKLGGHLRIRKVNGARYLDYLKDYVDSSEQVIQFGWNLMDFVTSYDETNFCTVLIPLGERYTEGDIDGLEGYLDITDLNGGRNYIVNQEAVNNFGWIERVEHFDNVTEDTELLQKGQEFLRDVQFGKMALEVSAVDLAYYDINYDEINILDEVRVKSIPHGLDRMFPVTELRIPLDNPGNSKFTLGLEGINTMSALSNSLSNTMGKLGGNGDIQPNESNILMQARQNARAIMDTVTTGYITIERNEKRTKSDAMYISNNVDANVATKRWRWNMGGLAFELRQNDGSYLPRVAITMDGAIVADFITTGTMSANRIRGGILESRNGNVTWNLNNGFLEIKSGSINLGSWNGAYAVSISDNGEVRVKNIYAEGGTFKHVNANEVYINRNDSSGDVELLTHINNIYTQLSNALSQIDQKHTEALQAAKDYYDSAMRSLDTKHSEALAAATAAQSNAITAAQQQLTDLINSVDSESDIADDSLMGRINKRIDRLKEKWVKVYFVEKRYYNNHKHTYKHWHSGEQKTGTTSTPDKPDQD